MLTNSDLQKITVVVKGEVKSEINPLVKDVGLLKRDTAVIKKGFKRVEKKLDFSIKYLDREFPKRIKRLEDHAELAPLDTF